MYSAVDRLLKYVKFNTKSDETTGTTPSTEGQLVLGRELKSELEELGLEDVSMDENGYIMATLPKNIDKEVKTIGFISHMDTSPDMTGENVNPKIVKNYDGNDIVLNEKENIILSPKDFPEIKNYIGRDIITTDGTTLLGADDKAGVSEIMAAVEYLVKHPEIPHGTIKIGFTPDEEIGEGADHFDVKKFGADFAYTVDGGPIGELECENFNAAAAKIFVKGRNVHPGTAKNKMINSMHIASEFIDMLPCNERPEYTEGHEGFNHLISIKGEVEETELYFIIRDFNREKFEERKKLMLSSAEFLNKKYGEGIVTLELRDQYYNMKEKIEPVKYIVDIAYKAMEELEITPIVMPIRGGTDGARLSFMGLPTPNIFTGGHNYHGKYEFIPTFTMDKAVDVILKIIELNSK
ncbi:peptidase T [Clostridium pasteurianum DSM 525 = ATCC 6013]|uniref:Peptidase T n=1 Tax=Clostridium pasteurianum DSM 525 = ATCC 6013 TaxID=1262449 RepID=A0A0H3J5V8_CLOPA|nr:peptidase T [Clostridium pasteurianum]AJA46315.1 peptidase T [Clostridium pasteurianum DSM 525 = ATCC 6013]AJA50303.1 peptidase T [Clostridium pasteurianum DSM 525 = ATCC 6013]AOZ73760.1 peptidase T [Clostridium pasteurianum DSM 525 = ATCC 6013]AOZ77557.1 peptidase T [Clostridium pasteurianum]ELP60893.1 peptidase T [Clostridium pasteurianum DSM 525 = ATCC 6013]